MTEHEPMVHARPTPMATPTPQRPFEVEDRTDPQTKALIAEAFLMREWVRSEREAGRSPN